MALSAETIRNLAQTLDRAMTEAREIERLTLEHPDLSLDDAYRIQDEGIRLRYSRGEQYAGLKMGLTSKAKMEQMNLRQPIYGVLTRSMRVADGGVFNLKGSIHPRIEPEIAFIIGRDLKGRVSREQALEAITEVLPAMEILDSRFLNFKYFSLPDVVADNCSSFMFVPGGTGRDPRSLDLGNLAMVMEIDGKVVQEARSDAILGHPLNSLLELCSLLDSRGEGLKAGSVVLAGAATQAVPLQAGNRVTLTVQDLGTVRVSVVG